MEYWPIKSKILLFALCRVAYLNEETDSRYEHKVKRQIKEPSERGIQEYKEAGER